MGRINKRYRMMFIVLAMSLALFFILDLAFGSVSIRLSELIHEILHRSDSETATLIWKFRIPRVLTALFVGLALSLSGLQMQTLFRNPMAGPYVLGLSSGASLGVALIILGFPAGLNTLNLHSSGDWLLVLSAWTGAGIVMLIMLLVSRHVRDIYVVLVIGLMLSGAVSAIVSLMQYFSNESMLKTYVIWTMGSLGNLTGSQLKVLVISVSAGMLLSVLSVKMLNALLLGDSYAMSIGLNIRFARTVIFVCTCILAGSVTAFCGPIGFIGIAVPHIARNLFRTSDHFILIPGSMLTGAALMLASDLLSQAPGKGIVFPVNSITSMIGIPVIFWVIFRLGRKTVTA